MPVSVNALRRLFLDYFARHEHAVLPSSSLVPHNDPTLLFTNSGMVQFKNVLTGLQPRLYPRAVTAQKCVRAGGKHNDLDNVGYTARHHTFFEMLGNFSFGDYFKDLAIELAWQLVTRELGLEKEKLLVTVYVDDDDAFALWRKIAGLDERRIIRIAGTDNFWSMGEIGPCGPCSEIFFDHGPSIPGGPPGSPDADGDRFIEMLNLVFMQYEQVDATTRVDLPRPSIDTGMGLERTAAVLQGVHDNYEIDLFRTLIAASEALTGTRAEGERRASHRVIADHLRAAAFLVADGVMPATEGRGYVLRRIMRRGMRHAHLLGAREPLLWRLVPTLVVEMGEAYPELVRAESLISEVLKLEETRFRQTLERGLRLLDEETRDLAPGATLPGEVAFKLYDTYGFPLDLTEDALRTKGHGVVHEGFEAAMARQKAAARAAWKGSGDAAVDSIWFNVRERAGPTEFLGYSTDRAEATVVALVSGGERVPRIEASCDALVVTSQTPFYGEAGGQQGDTGTITGRDTLFQVTDTQRRLGDLVVHEGRLERGSLAEGDAVELQIDVSRRDGLRRAHSATHLLHAALRRQFGTHVTQRGSLVAPDRLRFDFSHPSAISAGEIETIEAEVNRLVRQNSPVSIKVMERDAALAAGAMALFGEKYGDEVRVVAMGEAEDAKTYSIELCGGTHVRRTGDVAFVRIVAEAAVAAGIRRVEALSGAAAVSDARRDQVLLHSVAQELRVGPAELPERLEAVQRERRRLQRELTELRQQLATGASSGNGIKEVAGVRVAARVINGLPAKEMRGTAEAMRRRVGSGVVALVAVNDGKASVLVSLSEDLAERLDAVSILRRAVAEVGGSGGGGRRDFAQGGGPDGARAAEAIAAIEAAVAG